MPFLAKLFGDANQRYIKSLQPVVDKINALEKDFEKLTDEDLKKKTHDFRNRLQVGETLNDLLPEAFAAVREAFKRTMRVRLFDVQLMGGIVLHQGKIAEMRTGEGKTFVATLPAYLNSLEGKGVHVVTVNDYLSRRDTAWVGQVYNALGVSVGCINHDGSYVYDPSHTTKAEDTERDIEGGFKVVHEFLRPVSKKEAYAANITYGTNNEYGFDYLRDNMAYDVSAMSQRIEHSFAIVDEVDSILIDEARTPLIISAPDEDSGKLYETFAGVVPRLNENEDYNVDEKRKTVSITENGIEKVEKVLGIENIYEAGGVRHVHHLEQALKAHVLFKKDRDYVVKDGEIIIVDEFTGRLMPGRRWSEGLHQAVEAKEGVSVQKESRTLATITFQNYFRLYKKLSGMTGTAQTSAEEFHKVYNLDAVVVPTNKTAIRQDLPDRIYKTEDGKFKAVVREIKERHQSGQPVLVGTVSIEKNELLSMMLEREGIPHNVLNAKNHEKEAELHAQAGRRGAVTVATNMAGRGVDIILGGNPPDTDEANKVRELGGLHVIGTERHEARRIDNQLRGRAGRQGDPGSSQFFVSLSDDVIRIFGGERIKGLMDRFGFAEDEAIENRMVSGVIEQAQAKIEGHNFDTRKYVLEYDDVMNKHREATYRLRKDVLLSKDNKPLVMEFFEEFIGKLVDFHYSKETEPNIKEITETIKALTSQELQVPDESFKDPQILKDKIFEFVEKVYEIKEKEVGEDMRKLEKAVLLRTIDELWMDHIEAMDYLKQSVQLRGYGQRDPLIEYKTEGYQMFQKLQESIQIQVVNLIFKVSFTNQPKPTKMEENKSDSNKVPTQRGEKEIGRNDPCPCGAINPETGKPYKWKKCGMVNASYHKSE
ncbi:MAG: preprotein translocase subunit SecA [Candidatus Yanofskybacteria bacterium RIFCSPHIGHO2_02_FULL_41_11]|uniref:Protein translocase subunit SecA n=1 Tax=Candidatus Yanofskybacteria bacterium RIFCSPHIGHO2_02_FULL_41_11 TaxID=1802675 RepID=A0A1F8FBF7_9BACT|nr:MAG: preprotein translocase subunit SecA [Candidatus Yanofskybacteria bacterium RIFCSPHIGHO2_02_FULL_41_11]